MDFKTQFAGLNEFLTVIYGEETRLSTLLDSLGFEKSQLQYLRDKHIEPVVSQFIEVIRQRLTNESGKDRSYQVLARRYGLDGESPETFEAIALKHGVGVEYIRQLAEEAIQKCRYKSTLNDFNKSLQYIAIEQLSRIAPRPTRDYVSGKLTRLTNLQAAADVTRLDYEAKRAEVMKQVQAELEALETEYRPLLESADENLATLAAEIKNDVLLHGDSVQGGGFRAVYMQGRTSWDNDGMTKYAAAHPDVLKFRKQGQPSVALRTMEEKE
jgi:hypothetical protein